MSIYEKPIKLPFRDMVKDITVKKGDVIGGESINSWFGKKYPFLTIVAWPVMLAIEIWATSAKRKAKKNRKNSDLASRTSI